MERTPLYAGSPLQLCLAACRPANAVAARRMAALKGPGKRIWFWLFVALLLGHVVVLLASPHPPSLQDYPDWVYQGVLFAKLLAGHPVPGYVPKHYPVPNSLTTVGIGLLSLVMSWQMAAKVWLVLVFVSVGVACLRLLHALDGDHQAVLPVFACSVVAGLDLWNGSVNFQMSLALLLWLLACLVRQGTRPWMTGLLLMLCFFAHMLPCGTGLLALLALAIQERQWRRLLPAIPTVLLVAWYASARDPGAGQQSPVHLLPALLAVVAVLWWSTRAPTGSRADEGARAVLRLPLLLLAGVVVAFTKVMLLLGWVGPLDVLTAGAGNDKVLLPLAVFLVLCVLGVCAAALGGWTLGTTWLDLARTADPRRFLAVTAIALAALFLLSPADALGVTPIDSRFLHLALACGLGLLSLRVSRRVVALAVLATLIGVVNLVQFAAVQFRPMTVSVSLGQMPAPGSSPVAPSVRLHYYQALEAGRYDRWIFPTALFHEKLP